METKDTATEYPATSGRALIDHWSYVIGKGLMNENTAGALRSAVKQVLSIEKDGDNLDISKLDVDGLLQRWENLRRRDFKPKSLETYKQRFRQALSLYLSYLEDPGGYKPAKPKPERSNGKAKVTTVAPAPGSSVITMEPQQRGKVTDYPFPLRPDLIAHLYLPLDLKASEVNRLTKFMGTLVVDETSST